MALEVWVGLVELQQLPGEKHSVALRGKGAFTWIPCWASDVSSYKARVSDVMAEYGLFVVEAEQVEPFGEAENVTEELAELVERVSKDENYCIFGTLHNYPSEN